MSLGWVVYLDGVAFATGCDTDLSGDVAGFGFGEGPFGGGPTGENPFGGSNLFTFTEDQIKGHLPEPPSGLGLPPLRTEDVSYSQRDGVRHFNDWYEPRIITLAEVVVCSDDCKACPSVRHKMRDIMRAWGRRCDDTELVIYTDCHGEISHYDGDQPVIDRSLTGPFGVKGRPRVAETTWLGLGGSCATLTLRFDAEDHRMFVLDESGTPGSGGTCVTLQPDLSSLRRCYAPTRCYPRCYDTPVGEIIDPITVVNSGTECVEVTITLNGTLTNPAVENLTTDERLLYDSTISFDETPVIIETADGTATQGGSSRTHLLAEDVRMTLAPGDNVLRLTSQSDGDTGYAELCFRPVVVMA